MSKQREISRGVGYNSSMPYSKILATFYEDGLSAGGRSRKAHVSLTDTQTLNNVLSATSSDTYLNTAASDFSAIFYPFRMTRESGGSIPNVLNDIVISGVAYNNLSPRAYDVLPVYWDPAQNDKVYNLDIAPSGDAVNGLVSSDSFYGDVSIRDISNLRGIALRTPTMVVGWGYTVEGFPFPSGTAASGNFPFKGGSASGWQVDPKDYVAAPLDLRYDNFRNVWTTDNRLRIIEIGDILGTGKFNGKSIHGVDINTTTSGILESQNLGQILNNDDIIVWDLNQVTSSGNKSIRYGFSVGIDKQTNKEIVVIDGSQGNQGQFRGQQHMMTADATAGWAFPCFTPLLPY